MSLAAFTHRPIVSQVRVVTSGPNVLAMSLEFPGIAPQGRYRH
jgi:hypothetical protein